MKPEPFYVAKPSYGGRAQAQAPAPEHNESRTNRGLIHDIAALKKKRDMIYDWE